MGLFFLEDMNPKRYINFRGKMCVLGIVGAVRQSTIRFWDIAWLWERHRLSVDWDRKELWLPMLAGSSLGEPCWPRQGLCLPGCWVGICAGRMASKNKSAAMLKITGFVGTIPWHKHGDGRQLIVMDICHLWVPMIFKHWWPLTLVHSRLWC